MTVTDVLELILNEYERQHRMWPKHDWSPEYWLMILSEEIGEAAHEFLKGRPQTGIDELVQCAAVLLSWIECEMERLYDGQSSDSDIHV